LDQSKYEQNKYRTKTENQNKLRTMTKIKQHLMKKLRRRKLTRNLKIFENYLYKLKEKKTNQDRCFQIKIDSKSPFSNRRARKNTKRNYGYVERVVAPLPFFYDILKKII
jgi:hypothetical protein